VKKMKSTTKIITLVLIIIIVVAIGASAYIYEQNTQSGNQPAPTPTPSPTPTVNATVTTTNQTVDIGLGGNITETQISDVVIAPSESAGITTISFNITGTSGTGFSNMTIQKTAIPYGNTPTVYIDNQQATDQGYTQDANNYYVWYTTHFSTHQIIITFTESATPTPTPTQSSSPTASPTASPSPSPSPTPTPTPVTLTISSTTSLYETGIENGVIKPAFEAKYPWITVNFLAQGTGAAIQTAMRGDADMIMVHDPAQENTFMANGYGVNRKIIAYNFFIIVGPTNDPAGVTGMTPTDAMKRIYQLGQTGQAIWVSRGDGSGTNSKEKNLWAAAGINWTQIRTQTSWYKETGQGMTSTLIVANYLGGYTLADTASYLTNTNAKNIQLKIVIQAHRDLLNVYSVIADNPQNANLTNTHFDASMLFMQYMVSDEGQQLLANFGTATFGQALFAPFVPLASNPSLNATLLSWIQSYAYLPANATECPAQYRYNAGTLYSASYDALVSANFAAIINLVPNWKPKGETQTVDYNQAKFTQPLFSNKVTQL
jgi:tungstate transport system substrate-binding protein